MYPLSPAHDAVLNRSPSARHYDDDYEVRKHTTTRHASGTSYDDNNNNSDTMSSPLVSNTSAMTARSQGAESGSGSSRPGSTLGGPSMSPAKNRRHSRVISGTGLSPLKILNRKRSSEEPLAATEGMGPPPARSARKISSPEKRFPVKIGGGAGEEAGVRDRQVSLEEAMRTNGHLRRAIDIFEDDEDDEEAASRPDTAMSGHGGGCNPDDTMTSTFSTFSAAPTLTSYTNWRAQKSPVKLAALAGVPSSSRPGTRDECGNTTNLLMDFTDSLRHPRRGTASPDKKLTSSSTLPNQTAAATPSKAGMTGTLIDFDIPPLPTPRSMPTISSRELESLKSGFLSEISSLKASLSGKEAEVRSLKAAVGDAEARVGTSTEALREQTALREQAAAERDDWERRGRELEDVLHRMRREREEAERKLEEIEKRREAAEILHQEAESKIAGLRAGRETESGSSSSKKTAAAASPQQTNKEVEIAVERVARELHSLYKGKHETKVTALKKSYEARWEKKVKELERRVQDLREENASLQSGRAAGAADPDDTTLLVAAQANAEAHKEQATRDRAAIRELNATVRRLEAVVASVQGDNGELRELLEKERVEKGELVQLAEEMMSMQQHQSFVTGGKTPAPTTTEVKTPGKRPVSMMPTATTPGNRRGSVGKASGLRAPGSAYRGAAGLKMPGSRSGILSGIEKMGSHRGRGQ